MQTVDADVTYLHGDVKYCHRWRESRFARTPAIERHTNSAQIHVSRIPRKATSGKHALRSGIVHVSRALMHVKMRVRTSMSS